MKLSLQNEKTVYFGGKNEDVAWGFVQFPKFYEHENGSLGLYIHDEDDNPLSLGQGIWKISCDQGSSWTNATPEDVSRLGTRLPCGDMLRIRNIPMKPLEGYLSSGPWFGNFRIPSEPVLPSKPEKDGVLPQPLTTKADVFGSNDPVYLLDTLPDDVAEKKFKFVRFDKKTGKSETVYAPVEWKHRTVRSFSSSPVYTGLTNAMLANPGLYEGGSKIKVAPDGSLYITHSASSPCHPTTGRFEKFTAAFIFRSTDEGKSWRVHGHIPYRPDVEKDEFAYLVDGFCEPDIEFLKDGSMLCILRTCSVFQGAPEWGASYLSRSEDGGKTWSKPEYFQKKGALPLLLRLDCGALLAVVTRPGIDVYVSEDEGKTWERSVEVMTANDRSGLANVPPKRPNFHQWAGSCCNTDIYPIGKNRALLVYSDFYTPDHSDHDVKKKAIKTVEIVVDCE